MGHLQCKLDARPFFSKTVIQKPFSIGGQSFKIKYQILRVLRNLYKDCFAFDRAEQNRPKNEPNRPYSVQFSVLYIMVFGSARAKTEKPTPKPSKPNRPTQKQNRPSHCSVLGSCPSTKSVFSSSWLWSVRVDFDHMLSPSIWDVFEKQVLHWFFLKSLLH